MKNYLHDIPTKIYFGKGAIENLPTALSPLKEAAFMTKS